MRISDWSSDVCSSDLRATHARLLVDHCIHGDLMDTMISRQAFGLLWLNPLYGDLARDTSGNLGYEGKGRARLDKPFYQRHDRKSVVQGKGGQYVWISVVP